MLELHFLWDGRCSTIKQDHGYDYALYNIKIVEFHNGEIQLLKDNGYNILESTLTSIPAYQVLPRAKVTAAEGVVTDALGLPGMAKKGFFL